MCIDIAGHEQGRVLVNVDHDEGEPDIFLLPELAAHIKPHQIGGVRMMYDVIIESLAQYGKDDGYGCGVNTGVVRVCLQQGRSLMSRVRPQC